MFQKFMQRVGMALFPSVEWQESRFPWTEGIGQSFVTMIWAALLTIAGQLLIAAAALILWSLIRELFPALANLIHLQHDLVLAILAVVAYLVGVLWSFRFLISGLPANTSLSELVSLDTKVSWRKTFFIAVKWWIAMIVLVVIVDAILPLRGAAPPSTALGEHLHGLGFVVFACFAMLVAPIAEELLFRGFFFNMFRLSLRQRLSGRRADLGAAVITACGFAALHGSLVAFPHFFVAGMVLAEVYRRTGNLTNSMALHMMSNTIAVLALLFFR